MKLLPSLRGRIFVTTAMLALLSIGAAIYLVSVRVTRESEAALQREINATGELVRQFRETRAETFTMMARLIADAPRVKAAVDTNDPPTVQDIASEYQDQLHSNLLLVTNETGEVLATVGASPREALIVAGQPSVRAAAEGREGFSLIPRPEGMLQLVTVPIAIGLSNPDIQGTLSVGFLLDDALALQLKGITGSEIAFGMDGQVLATTLPAEDRAALAAVMRSRDSRGDVTLPTGTYSALPLPLSANDAVDAGTGPVAFVLRSRAEQLALLRTINTELAVTALVAVLAATLLSFGVARTITRPLATITDVMRQVSTTGDLTRKIPVRGSRWADEDARLLATTFNALTDSIARFQREVSQKERLSALGRLSTVIAHEIRNPLMIIKTALHALRQPDLERARLGEAVTDIDDEVARLNRVVNEVLDFARPIRFEQSVADINLVCRESAAAAQAAPGPAVYLDLAASLPPVTTDAERLRVALVNLMVNARHAAEANAPAASAGLLRGHDAGVVVSTLATDSRVAIIVADRGAGIAAADLPRVFDPYFTTKRGGTGLGLPIARNIVEGLGGVISITSQPGLGTEIRIELPLGAPPT
jgi:signal transduction histidine kinase